ncbi:hypothetical protein KR200_002017 [Drosophila serrata]|nr:hypothetical protein KR200_002017 [Drosophila serrata]
MSQNYSIIPGTKLEDLVVCPYDSNHRLLPNRLAVHLVRCGRNYSSKQKEQCGQTCAQIHSMMEMKSHAKVCQNGCALEKAMNPVMVTQEKAQPSDFCVESTEDWDAEPPSGTYDPLDHCEKHYIIRNPQGNAPAARREFRARERLRFVEKNKF